MSQPAERRALLIAASALNAAVKAQRLHERDQVLIHFPEGDECMSIKTVLDIANAALEPTAIKRRVLQ